VPNPYGGYLPETDPNYSSWFSEEQDRLDGEASDVADTYYQGSWHHYDDTYDWIGAEGGTTGFDDTFSGANGGSVTHESSGKIRTKYRWVPEMDPFTGLPDPTDIPPDLLNLKINASARAGASSDDEGTNRNTSKEHVAVSVMNESSSSSEDTDYYDPIINCLAKGASLEVTKLVSVTTNGETEVFGPWVDLSASAKLDGDRSVVQYDEEMGSWEEYLSGRTILYLAYDSQLDNRSVTITSPTIDDSYQLISEEVLPLLGPSVEFRSGTPEPPADGPYSVKHRRESDNSIYTDSVAHWFGTEDGVGVPGWYGGGEFVVNTPNFSLFKSIEWSVDGGTLTDEAEAATTNNRNTIDISPQILPGSETTSPKPFGIDLGGDADGSSMTTLSKITAKVTDNDGTEGTNTYAVRWHKPYENWTITNSYPAPTVTVWTEKEKAGSTVELDYDYDFEQVGFDFGAALGKGAAYLGAASPVAVFTSAAPAAPHMAALAGILQVASLIVQPNPPVVPQQVDNSELTYAKYKAAVIHAENNEFYPNGQKYYDIGINPEDDLDGTARFARFLAVKSDFQANENGDNDTIYETDTKVDAQVVMHPVTHDWSSHAYDVHGYAGEFYGSTTNADSVPTIQPTWYYDPGTPNS